MVDHELLRRWRDGESQAAENLVARHFDRVYTFFVTKIDRDWEDLTQEVFARGLQRADRLRPEASFRAFLMGIAHRVLLEAYRRREVSPIDEERSAEELCPSPSQAARIVEERQLVLKALRRIPLECQVAIELHYWEEMPLAEIAAALEIPEGTVKSRLHRGRQALAQQVEAVAADRALKDATLSDIAGWISRCRAAVSPSET